MRLVSLMWPLITYPSFHFSFPLEWNWTQPSSCLHPYVRSKYFTFNLHSLGFSSSFTTCFLFPLPYFYINVSKTNTECSLRMCKPSNSQGSLSSAWIYLWAQWIHGQNHCQYFLEKHLGMLRSICPFFLPIYRSWCRNFLARPCWEAEW